MTPSGRRAARAGPGLAIRAGSGAIRRASGTRVPFTARPRSHRRYGRARIIPPSTGTMAPVTYDAAGDSRNAPTRPISSGSP